MQNACLLSGTLRRTVGSSRSHDVLSPELRNKTGLILAQAFRRFRKKPALMQVSHRAFQQAVSEAVQPERPGFSPQPGQLPLGELTGGDDGVFGHRSVSQPAVQMRPDLPVTDCPDRRQVRVQITSRPQFCDFGDQTLIQHDPKSLFNALMQRAPIHWSYD